MDRMAWRSERQQWNQFRMDMLFAPTYDEDRGEISPAHRAWLERFLDLCPHRGRVLDAACGTGKYWPLLRERGLQIAGIDHSQQMLEKAQSKFPDVPVMQLDLQDLSFQDRFDGILCVDAMDNIFPEDWPGVLKKFFQALHEHGHVYLTVEVETDEGLEYAYDMGVRLGWPLVYGEYAHTGSYHYYPPDEQVRTWLKEVGFTILDMGEGDNYRHYLIQK